MSHQPDPLLKAQRITMLTMAATNVHPGKYINRHMTYPCTDYPLRTDESFENMVDESHHEGPHPFHGSSVGLISQFPLDHMYLVCLGGLEDLFISEYLQTLQKECLKNF